MKSIALLCLLVLGCSAPEAPTATLTLSSPPEVTQDATTAADSDTVSEDVLIPADTESPQDIPINPCLCEDGNPCTIDTCVEAQCLHTALPCEDNNPCTNDTCNPQTGACETSPNQASCDDGNPCTVQDTCSQGSCLPGPPADCSDGNTCTVDFCDMKGCQHQPISGPSCSDGNPCTLQDVCQAGSCLSGSPMPCPDDGNPCTIEKACKPSIGVCEYSKPAGIPCDDDSACTAQDACKDGKCGGATMNCDDGNPCTVDTCDPKTGTCTFTLDPTCDECSPDDPPPVMYQKCAGNACTDPQNCPGYTLEDFQLLALLDWHRATQNKGWPQQLKGWQAANPSMTFQLSKLITFYNASTKCIRRPPHWTPEVADPGTWVVSAVKEYKAAHYMCGFSVSYMVKDQMLPPNLQPLFNSQSWFLLLADWLRTNNLGASFPPGFTVW